MNSLLYVLKTGYKNKLKKAVKKPGFYIYVLFLGFYIWIMIDFFYKLVVKEGYDNPKYLVMVITVLNLYFGPMNYAAYAKRKGLTFLPSHIHFMFPSPVSPKLLLLFGQLQGQIMSFIFEILLVAAGLFWFNIPVTTMFLYFILVSCFNVFSEGGLVVCLYGNEFFKEKTIKILSKGLWLVLGALVACTAAYMLINGFSFQSFLEFLLSDWICYIPVLGWQVGLMRLIILGPSTATVIGGVCYA